MPEALKRKSVIMENLFYFTDFNVPLNYNIYYFTLWE